MKPFFATFIALLVLGMHTAMACEGCRAPGLLNEQQTVLAGIGFSWSIIIMLGFVFSLLGGMTWYISYTCKQLDRSHDSRGE